MKQSAVGSTDEALDMKRSANAPVGGRSAPPVRCIARHCIELHLASTDEQATTGQPRRQHEAAGSNRKTLQARSAIQIDRAAKRRFDTLLFELAKHLDDTHSTRFTRGDTHSLLNKVLYERSNANRKQDFSSANSFIAREKMVQTVLN
ncbi:hypothetical protein PQR46_31760 [Paraburkholderia sediminicola]|uniref:hypothetical protein n=1 Tax=Paraburkholderia TaxID=1822464 RepID=UPI0038BA67A6